ncbi:hypothetical protein NL532_24065 [Mesorhizobium sp. C120A]|uniref:hypothetical protein n=1 Tax=unclassified Mesorhizobium TaxID=325217 RepID=UPI0003D01B80|nr:MULTISPECIES: hypothetical protein [unclassified Mesorhizobium]ESZ60650.1 hypothetical protein X728_15020 [Mesorhizobium sp. L103C120A0]WJI43685.1 hypothetical protein NL532_24065 [Mesorhizobium sp. C120A]
MQKILIADASAKQLADYAETVLGLEGVDYRLGKGKIEEKMRAVLYDKDFIEVEDDEAPIARINPPAPTNARRMATIIIPNQDKAGGTEPVPVAVNGRQLWIPRQAPQTIPWEYMHALDNAKKFVYETDGNGTLILPPSEVHEYPFSVLHEDPPLIEKAA